jgi:hypothetical protein
MKLDEIENLIAAASPGPWPKLIARVDIGWIGHGPGHPSEGTINRALNDALFIAASRTLMPRLLTVIRCIKFIRDLGDYANDRDWAALDQALADLEQP